ncbi:MAG: polyphenol oxidase family protein [Pseudomonadota bacterium]
MHIDNTIAGAIVRSRLIDSVPGTVHGFGVRGVAAAVYLDAMGIGERYLARTDQIHGRRVHRLPAAGSEGTLKGDSFITDCPGTVCFVRSADCVPILIADSKRGAVAAVHAGWRGTSLDVAGETIRAMGDAFGTDPGDCAAAIGPRICGGCYEVGVEVIRAFEALAIGDGWRAGPARVDLGKACRLLLERAGVPQRNIAILPQCTCCDATFASWRRDGKKGERQFSFIISKYF